ARREVGLDPVPQRREVDGTPVRKRDTPGAVTFREREERSTLGARVGLGRRARVPAGNVQIDDGAAEQLVAHGAADDPRLLARQDLARPLKHRPPPGAPAPAGY